VGQFLRLWFFKEGFSVLGRSFPFPSLIGFFPSFCQALAEDRVTTPTKKKKKSNPSSNSDNAISDNSTVAAPAPSLFSPSLLINLLDLLGLPTPPQPPSLVPPHELVAAIIGVERMQRSKQLTQQQLVETSGYEDTLLQALYGLRGAQDVMGAAQLRRGNESALSSGSNLNFNPVLVNLLGSNASSSNQTSQSGGGETSYFSIPGLCSCC